MSLQDEQVSALNQIMAAIDQKANEYKNNITAMPKAKAFTEKKLILDLIQDGLELAGQILPKPVEVIGDLNALREQLNRLG